MTSYYNTQKEVFEKIDKLILEVIENDTSLNIPKTIVNLTRGYPIGQKAVEKRIKLVVLTNPHVLQIVNDEVVKK